MATIIGDLVAMIRADPRPLKKGAKEAEQALDKSTGRMKSTLMSFKGVVAGAFSVIAVQQFTKSVLEAGVEMERLQKSMNAAVGSAQASGAAMAFLRTESERLGLSLPSQVKGFQQLAAAAQGTAMQGRGTVEVFTAVSEASTSLQLSSEQTAGAILALTQIISKGKVQAEELRGQLGERIPGAFQIASKAMGMTTAELSKALEMGEIYADDFLPKFAKTLKERYSRSWEDSAKSTQASINRLSTAWFEFRSSISEGGLGDFYKMTLDGLTSLLNSWQQIWGAMKNFFITWFFDPVVVHLIMLREDFNLMMSLITGSFQAGIKLMVQALGGMIQTFANLTAGIPFLGELNKNLQMSADNANAAAAGMKGFGDILTENMNRRREALDQHALVIDSMIEENLNYKDLTESALSFADAVGTANEQRVKEVELTKEQIELWETRIEEAKEGRKALLDYEINTLKEQRLREEELTKEVIKNEKAKAKVRKQVADQSVQDAKFALKTFGEHNRAAFEAFKVISIAETVVNTSKAAMGAYSAMASIPFVGPALAAAAAGAAIAAGAAQIAVISSMSPSGGGSATTAGLSSGGASAAIGTFPASPTTGLPDLQAGTGGAQGAQTIIDMREIRVDSEERIAQIANQLKDLFEEKDIVGQTTVRT